MVLVADFRMAPLEFAQRAIHNVLKGVPVFRMIPLSDTRFRALADGCRDDPVVRLACSVYLLGQYLVATMGKFLLPRGEVGLGKDGSEMGQISLLNEFVKVIKVDFIDFNEDAESE